MSYTWEKFHEAIRTLAGKGTQQERIISAYSKISRLEPDNIPEEIQEDFRELEADITKVQGDEGSVKATVRQMNEGEISRVIDKIISMHNDIMRLEESLQ